MFYKSYPLYQKLQPLETPFATLSRRVVLRAYATCRCTTAARGQSSYNCYTQTEVRAALLQCAKDYMGRVCTTHRSIAVTVKYDEPGLQAARKNKRVKTASAVETHPHATSTGTQIRKNRRTGGGMTHADIS